MTSILPKGTLGSVASLLAATLYQGNPDRTTSSGISYHLRDIYSICRCCWTPPVFSGVRVTRSLVVRVCIVDRCLSFCTFSFGHCVVCSLFDMRILIAPLVSSSSFFHETRVVCCKLGSISMVRAFFFYVRG
jgi:hypothetical protein